MFSFSGESYSGTQTSGGAAGGSVYIEGTTSVSLTGTITANGGNGNSGAGGGAGGLVAVVYSGGLIGGKVTCYGGTGTEIGGPGPVYYEQTSISYKKVSIQQP